MLQRGVEVWVQEESHMKKHEGTHTLLSFFNTQKQKKSYFCHPFVPGLDSKRRMSDREEFPVF